MNRLLVAVALIAVTFGVASCQWFGAKTNEITEFILTAESVKVVSENQTE